MPELRAYLSRVELPLALYELFSWLEKYFIQCENFPPGKFPNKECVQQLVNEFVFNQTESVPKVGLILLTGVFGGGYHAWVWPLNWDFGLTLKATLNKDFDKFFIP